MQPINNDFFSQPVSKAYICAFSNKIMEEPVLGLCSHLFDSSVLNSQKYCPHDKMPLLSRNVIYLPDLGKKIGAWVLRSRILNIPTLQASNINTCLPMDKKLEKMSVECNQIAATIAPTKVVQNAHQDDIHGLILLPSSQQFISGSKDSSLKIWGYDGKLKQNLLSDNKGYKYWITALAAFDEEIWAAGTRDGMISFFDRDGNNKVNLFYNPGNKTKKDLVAKDRNKSRIHCIAPSGGEGYQFYIGTPGFMQLWNAEEGLLLRSWRADVNDWVYCIEPLNINQLAVVIGARLEMWDLSHSQNPKKDFLIQEDRKYDVGSGQRPHISALVRVGNRSSALASALFDGTVRIVDFEQRKQVKKWKEHEHRVWSVVNLKPEILASSADDRTIKIWDLRMKNSALTISNQIGRVSSLLKIDDFTLVSASCPDDLKNSKEKASLSFWDLRKLTESHQ